MHPRSAIVIGTCLLFSSAHVARADAPATLSGYIDASVYPPHNEFDPSPRIPFPDRVVAAYALELSLEVRPVSYPRLFFFANPKYYFGDRRPQIDYQWSAKPLAVNLVYGAGITVLSRPNLELRIAHGEWQDLGGYPHGEKMPWNSVSVRWNFGSRDRP